MKALEISSKPDIFIALDVNNKESAINLIEELSPYDVGFKVGLEMFVSQGSEILEVLQKKSKKIFLDLKLHDIPITVEKTIKSLISQYSIYMLTVHSHGGSDMLKAAILGAQGSDTKIAAVTILTSIKAKEALKMGFRLDSVGNLAYSTAQNAYNAGIRHFVCAPRDISFIKSKDFDDIHFITPGVRLDINSHTGSQTRISTPKEAVDLGSDYLVIGREVTLAENPSKALENILNSII